MSTTKHLFALSLLIAAGTVSASRYGAAVEDSFPVQHRVDAQAEQDLQSKERVELLMKLEHLSEAVRTLNGKLEVANHQISLLRKQQLTQFSDLDKRLAAMEASSGYDVSASASVLDRVNVDKAAASGKDKEEIDYDKAYHLLKSQKFTEARDAFQTFLKSYPEGLYAANAHYWLGELALLNTDSSTAMREFTTIVEHFPKSSKVPDALLKLGFLSHDMGKTLEAKRYLSRVTTGYGTTSAAKLAMARLKQIETTTVQ